MAQFVNVGTNTGHQAKNGTNGSPGRTVIFFRNTSLKIGTVRDNPVWMVTLVVTDHFNGPERAVGPLCVYVCLCVGLITVELSLFMEL